MNAGDRDLYRYALNAISDVVFELDFVSRQTLVDRSRFYQLFQAYPADKFQSGWLFDVRGLVHPDDQQRVFDQFSLANLGAAGPGVQNAEFRIRNREREYIWIHATIVPIHSDAGALLRIIGTLQDIDERKRSEQAIRQLAQKDFLTGLLNRKATESLVSSHLAAGAGNFVLMLLDIDRFKAVNDHLGHPFGDAVLAETAARLRNLFRSTDVVGRLGGDEFLVFMRNVGDTAAIARKAQDICDACRRTYSGAERDYPISASIGIACYPKDGLTYGDLYRCADYALYDAKSQGRDCYRFFDPLHAANRYLESVQANSAPVSADSRPHRERFSDFVFSALYGAADFDQALSSVLALIGERYGVDRMLLLETNPDGLTCGCTLEWTAPGIPSCKPLLQRLPYSRYFAAYKDALENNGVLYIPDTAGLEDALLSCHPSLKTRSVFRCAIMDQGQYRGFLGFDICRNAESWPEARLNGLASLLRLIGLFIVKERGHARLNRFDRHVPAALDAIPLPICVLNRDNHQVLFSNQTLLNLAPHFVPGDTCHHTLFGLDAPCSGCGIGVQGERPTTVSARSELLGEGTVTPLPWPGCPNAAMICYTGPAPGARRVL